MTASAGARPSAPRAANEVAINPVAVLLCSTAVTARPIAMARRRAAHPGCDRRRPSHWRSSAPKPRSTPVVTMWVPQRADRHSRRAAAVSVCPTFPSHHSGAPGSALPIPSPGRTMVRAEAAVCGGYTTISANAASQVHFLPMLGGSAMRRLSKHGTRARGPRGSTGRGSPATRCRVDNPAA
jgi:hypothetical protein